MQCIKGPALFLAQFTDNKEPFNSWDSITRWAVVEWECCLKHLEDGAREGTAFVKDHIIRVTEKAFDDFAGGKTDIATIHEMLGV